MKGWIAALGCLGLAATAAGAAERFTPPAPRPLPTAAAAIAIPSLAPSALTLVDRPHLPAGSSGAFLSAYLAPQMARRLAPLGEWFATSSLAPRSIVEIEGIEVRQNAEHLALKATRKAVRSWLGDRFEPEVTIGGAITAGSTSTREGTRVRFGVASLRPRMTVEREVGAGLFRFGVSGSGDAHVEWRPAGRQARVGAEYDGEARRFGVNLSGTF